MDTDSLFLIAVIIVGVFLVIPGIVASFLRNVEAGTIRIVSWLHGGTLIYRGPGKSKEVPLLTTGTTISSKVINVDLDITDQTADVDVAGHPKPIKVRVLASAIVSVGDSDAMIKTAANRFFSKSESDQVSTLTDLLSSSGRRAINLLTHDQLFSARSIPIPRATLPPAAPSGDLVSRTIDPVAMVVAEAEEDDDPLAVIIRKACSRELSDLGLVFNSLNIKIVHSEVAEARRRQSTAEAQANADIVAAQQSRRAREAHLEAERVISDRQRELEQTRAENAVLIAQAEAKKQDALAVQRTSELDATQIAQARADAERVRIGALASAEAEAIRIRTVADATAESIRVVNDSVAAGGERYFRYRQIELLPQIAPAIAEALGRARLVTVSGGGGASAPEAATQSITSVIQTVLAAQLVAGAAFLDGANPSAVGASTDGESPEEANGAPPVGSPPRRR